jgi:hypothetical protein
MVFGFTGAAWTVPAPLRAIGTALAIDARTNRKDCRNSNLLFVVHPGLRTKPSSERLAQHGFQTSLVAARAPTSQHGIGIMGAASNPKLTRPSPPWALNF